MVAGLRAAGVAGTRAIPRLLLRKEQSPRGETSRASDSPVISEAVSWSALLGTQARAFDVDGVAALAQT